MKLVASPAPFVFPLIGGDLASSPDQQTGKMHDVAFTAPMCLSFPY